jgi:hypothetical protein
MMALVERRGYEFIVKKPKLVGVKRELKEVRRLTRKLAKQFARTEYAIAKKIRTEERRRGIFPSALRAARKVYQVGAEKEREWQIATKGMLPRQLQMSLNMLSKNVGKMSYDDLQKEYKRISMEYNDILEERKKYMEKKKRKKVTLDEVLEDLMGGEPMHEQSDIPMLLNSYKKMKVILLNQMLQKERTMGKLGKVV